MVAPTAALMDEINKIDFWWHKIDLGNGITTPGRDDSPSKLVRVNLPQSLQGLSVLDIGAWDGFFSFECERRGAKRVVALDKWVWDIPSIGKRGFELARRVLGSKVEDVELDVLDISPERVGVFDLVLFLGVLYHMPHPLLALERVASVVGKQLILETHIDMNEYDRPVLAFYPEDECANDGSNWFGPNRAAVEAMLRVVGFRKVELVSSTLSSTPVRRKPDEGYIRGAGNSQYGRMVFHAWK
jgi:tRNA (mo5U34)-methyltransferase